MSTTIGRTEAGSDLMPLSTITSAKLQASSVQRMLGGMTDVLLFEHPLSPYSQKNKIALREKGVPFSLVTPNALGSGGAGGSFAAANPRAEVPALVHGDLTVFDSTIIQEYIEEIWPKPALLPSTPPERARVRMIEEVMDTQYEAIVWGFMEVRVFGRASGQLGETLLERGRQQLAGLHAWLERQLGRCDWFNGASFGWGDIAVAPFVLGAVAYQAGPSKTSALNAWLGRVLARDSVAQTAAEARAGAAAVSSRVGDSIRSGAFKREYRDHRLEWMIRSGGLQVVRDGLAADNIRFSTELS
jgi:glutathione S-transferase/RNA polymerase-associated protein